MAEPLDVVMAMEQARHIIGEMRDLSGQAPADQPDIIQLTGYILMAGEIHHLTTAVDNLKLAV